MALALYLYITATLWIACIVGSFIAIEKASPTFKVKLRKVSKKELQKMRVKAYKYLLP